MHTCGSTTIDWAYTGPPINMTLWVTNIGVQQTEFIPANQNLTLSTRINPASQHYAWSPVNVSAGHYQLVASIVSQGFQQRSPTFLVKEGTFSCLTTPFSTGTTVIPAIATDAVSHTGATSGSLSTGGIVGVVVGALSFIVLAAIGIFFFLKRRKREVITRRQDFARDWRAHSANSSVRTVVATNYDDTDKYGGSRSEEKITAPVASRKESVTSHASLATFSTVGSPGTPSQLDNEATESTQSHAMSTEDRPSPRQSFGRKRKPAPAYDGEAGTPPLPSSTLSSPASNPNLGLSPSPLSPPRPLAGEEGKTRPRSATLGHYALRTTVESRPSTADGGDLLHKASFGPTVEGKQLHYLIPDLPAGSPAR